MKAIRLHAPTGIDGLKYEEVPDPAPAFDDVPVKVHACGITPRVFCLAGCNAGA
jgi:NADPH:quinone reductase-like Zn-dependent oxidoreductase